MPTRDSDLLARAIQASGLSSGDYARLVLIRDPRLVRRWLAGTLEMPTIVREHLERLEKQRLEKLPCGRTSTANCCFDGACHYSPTREERLEDG